MKPKLRILLVDDQPTILLTYTLILEQQGYAVASAATCEQAERLLREEAFDLLLCDFGLDGGRSGFEVVDLARARNPEIGSVLLTGFASSEIDEQAADRQTLVLTKPVEVPELLRKLETLVRTRQAQKPVVSQPRGPASVSASPRTLVRGGNS